MPKNSLPFAVKVSIWAPLATHHFLHGEDGSGIAPLRFGLERGDAAWWVG
jgi:hypothetical protein